MIRHTIALILLILTFPAASMAGNSRLQHALETLAPSASEIARPGYTPVRIEPLRAEQIAWNKHGYAVLLYSVTLEEPGFEGLESYLLNAKTNANVKIEEHAVRGRNLDVPVLRVADINKDGTDELLYVYSFDAGGYRIVEALVLKEEVADGRLVQLEALSSALREFRDFNHLSGSSGGQAAKVDIAGINTAIDAFIQEYPVQ